MAKQDIIDLAVAVMLHVRACFDVEHAKLQEIIDTGTTNMNTGWPG
jgi:hypothetical protein